MKPEKEAVIRALAHMEHEARKLVEADLTRDIGPMNDEELATFRADRAVHQARWQEVRAALDEAIGQLPSGMAVGPVCNNPGDLMDWLSTLQGTKS